MAYGGEGEGGGHRGIPVRLIIAVLIAIFAVVSYMARTEVNPVTGRKQHIGMSVDEEKALGLQAAPEMAQQMGGDADDSSPGSQEVHRVGRKVVDGSDAAKSPYADNFHFHLLNDPKTINAFALPGGQIFITKALYDKLENEAELAGVLGHEAGHVVGRHSAVQMATGRLGQLLATAVGVGASDDQGHGRAATMAAMMANKMLQLKYGRGDETEADEFGLKYMAEAGYDPRAMLSVMKILKEASQGGRQPEFLSSHPLPETRLEDIDRRIKEAYPNGVPDNLTLGRPLNGATGAGEAQGRSDGGIDFNRVFQNGR